MDYHNSPYNLVSDYNETNTLFVNLIPFLSLEN